LTYADIFVYIGLDAIVTAVPDALAAFPLLHALKESVAARPKIAAWIANRPVTGF
jgi:hypothetical protein